MWQQVGQSVRLKWLTLADKLATGGRHQTAPGKASVPGQPVPADSKHSAAPSRQIHWHENTLCAIVFLFTYHYICQSRSECMRFFSRGRKRLVFNHTLGMEEAVKSNCFSTSPGVKNLLVKWAAVLFSNFLMSLQHKLPEGKSSPPLLPPPCCFLLLIGCLVDY